MDSQDTDFDYDKATPAELFDRLEKALIELTASKDIKKECSPLPSGGHAYALVITDRAREILDPLARPLRQSIEDFIDRYEQEGVIELFEEYSGPHVH